MEDLTGKQFGHYQIVAPLGEGGMAAVYKAYQPSMERYVAVKVLPRHMSSSEEFVNRFKREAKLLAQLQHPHILPVFDYGEAEGYPYIVMPFVQSGTLSELLQKRRLPLSEIRRITSQIGEALSYAHSRGMIHRDIKPSNVLIDERGNCLLTDFGLARMAEASTKITTSGAVMGTPAYMSPEQGAGSNIDNRSDIYSLGIILYEMVTGRVPYTAETPVAIVFKHIQDPLPSARKVVPELPESVELVLLKSLAKNPDDRYQHAEDFVRAIQRAISDTPLDDKTLTVEEKTLASTPTPKVSEPVTPEKTVSEKQEKLTVKTGKPARSPYLAFGIISGVILLAICGFAALRILPSMLATAPATETSAPVAQIQPTNKALPAGPFEVTLWHTYGTGSAEEVAFNVVIEKAKTDLPNITLNVLQIPFGDIYNKYRTEVAAGGGPDIFIAPNDDLGNDARANLIADITDLAAGRLDNYSELGIDGMTVDGRLYGIPESMKAIAFWYNKDLLPTPPATTAELKALMEVGTPVGVNYGCYHMYGFYDAFGGRIFDDNWNIIADQGTGVTDTFTYLNDLYKISKKNRWATNDSDGLAPFTEGKLAAIINGNWAMSDYRNAIGDKLAVTALPTGPAGPAAPMLGVDGYYFNPNSNNKEAALEVALYLTDIESQTVMMNEGGHLPVRTDIIITDPLYQDLVDAFNKGATIRPQVPELGKYWSNFCVSDQIYEQGVAPADFVKAATDAANK